MHRVDSEVARPSFRLRFAPLADGHLYGSRFGVVHAALAIARTPAQIVNVGHRYRR
jgi:hypothetical protein